jgi:pyruvate dehydrogenase E2 component (dihydrolipoamide acetyltransferase)
MAEVILMPRLSDTMTEGVIAAWHKNVGDPVRKGELLAEVETDKATMELESYKDGVLLHIGTQKGGKLQVNDLLAIIGQAGEDIIALISAPSEAPTQTSATTPASTTAISTPTPATEPNGIDLSKVEEVVLMPRLSDTMESGVIAAWHKKVGDPVQKGEILAEIETDKATMELESYKTGTLLHIGAQAGEKIDVNALLCIIGDAGKVDVPALVQAAASTPAPSTAASPDTVAAAPAPINTPAPAPVVSVPAPVTSGSNQSDERIKASPLAKKIAQDKGLDLRSLQGSGDGGRIIKADIDNYQPQTASLSTAPTMNFTEGHTDIPNSQMRNVIAKRLGESLFSAPHFYLTMEIGMDNAMSARTQLNEVSPVKVSFNDMVVKAVALSLKKHPAINASWMGDKIRRYSHVHIGVAVAIEDGLIVPVIRFADQKTLPQIAAESKELAGKAKGKKLQPNEFSGNTFTISNLGMMDIEEFTAIINPPDSCILAVGRIKEVVIRQGNGFGVTNVMKVTLSCDHRSVDGATGAAFLQSVKKYLENPLQMFL